MDEGRLTYAASYLVTARSGFHLERNLMSNGTPAGWYDDGTGRHRWWDGFRWTDQFTPALVLAQPPAPATARDQLELVSPLPNKLGWASLGVAVFGVLLAVLPGLSLVAWIPALVAVGLGIAGLVSKNRRLAAAVTGISIAVFAMLIGIVLTVMSISLGALDSRNSGSGNAVPSDVDVAELSAAPTAEPGADRRATVVWEGQGEGASAKAILEGDYVVTWEAVGSCYYSATLDDEAFENVFTASDAATGTNNLYGLEAGEHFVSVITGPAPDCGWRVTFTPQ
ncbi:DUF2510 domain-containing protein [Microbacterium sp. CFBP9034]|uniref:DUF2510 domain-containing protein n=1 Tax=Microbacterium sp. CFBP9034 TaxID=3096540 RepID=UPI002A69F994|nr:DUF2510 domain-containing protein [Microbacterium sp. CFBP9034]MDY0910893.1 DUF2510 domain-containing protein [Microbacterium sp. CFBP9034]